MAAQTDAPDDLIAELARLMADDARSDQTARPQTPTSNQPVPVRIPGENAAAPRPSTPVTPTVDALGNAPQPEKSQPDEPNRYDLGAGAPIRSAGPATPIPSAAPTPSTPAPAMPVSPKPAPIAAEPSSAELDQDGLADLIAAELAGDLGVEPTAPAPGPARSEDNFGVPPVFGLGAKKPVEPVQAPRVVPEPTLRAEPVQTAAEPPRAPVQVAAAPSGPLADIERLVGPAVQLSGSPSDPSRTPSPALRSLATPTLPSQRPNPSPAGRTEPSSVDDAILAAAAATGARVEWVDPDLDDDAYLTYEDRHAVHRSKRGFAMSRAVAGPLVAVLLLGIAGGGLYWALGQGGAPEGPAPLLTADATPIKEVPEQTAVEETQSVVFNEISGTNDAADEQIVPRNQADEAVLSEPETPAPTGSGVLTAEDSSAIDPNQEGLVNRKVRTVTVRPDGTIISSNGTQAGSSVLPVDRPNVPAVPGAETSAPDLIASTIASANAETPAAMPSATTAGATTTPSTTDAGAGATPTAEAPAPSTGPIVEPGSTVAVIDSNGAPLAGRTVTVPMQRPSDFAQMSASALSATAQPATPAAQSAASTPAAAASTQAAAYVQVGSQRSEEAAQQTVQAINTRFGVLFGGASPQVQRVDLGERGIYYRVLVPADSREAASNICTNMQAAGGDCFLL